MVVFDDIVGELLMQNNCVVIPSLGGFVANTVAAKVDVNKGVITPPRKALSFNKNLTNNDGLLINAWAERKNVGYNDASTTISSEVSRIRTQLDKGERVHFQNVGFLYLNSAGKMAFEQDRFFNLLLESYGMGSVQFVPVEAEKEETTVPKEAEKPVELSVLKGGNAVEKEAKTVAQPVSSSVSEETKPRRKSSTLKKVVRYAAAAALIPVAFYSFWIPMKTDVLQSGVIYSEDFNPFSKTDEPRYIRGLEKDPMTAEKVVVSDELEKITSHLTVNSGEVFSYPVDDDFYVTVRYNKHVDQGTTNRSENKQGYHLIVGCFSEKANADGMLAKLNKLGWQGEIVDQHEGLYRVSATSSHHKKVILKKRSQIEQDGLSSWVLKK